MYQASCQAWALESLYAPESSGPGLPNAPHRYILKVKKKHRPTHITPSEPQNIHETPGGSDILCLSTKE